MNSPPDQNTPQQGGADPWAAFGYLVAGVLFYGLLGWLLSIWLHAQFWIPVGILVGAGFGMYLVFAQLRVKVPAADHRTAPSTATEHRSDHDRTTSDDEAARITRPDSDDRGETA